MMLFLAYTIHQIYYISEMWLCIVIKYILFKCVAMKLYNVTIRCYLIPKYVAMNLYTM